jgi:hypothetical protein
MKNFMAKIKKCSQALEAHTCNPSYLGGRDQEDRRSQPVQIVHETLSQKNPSQKRAGGVAQSVGHEFKPQYRKKKKNKTKCRQILLET